MTKRQAWEELNGAAKRVRAGKLSADAFRRNLDRLHRADLLAPGDYAKWLDHIQYPGLPHPTTQGHPEGAGRRGPGPAASRPAAKPPVEVKLRGTFQEQLAARAGLEHGIVGISQHSYEGGDARDRPPLLQSLGLTEGYVQPIMTMDLVVEDARRKFKQHLITAEYRDNVIKRAAIEQAKHTDPTVVQGLANGLGVGKIIPIDAMWSAYAEAHPELLALKQMQTAEAASQARETVAVGPMGPPPVGERIMATVQAAHPEVEAFNKAYRQKIELAINDATSDKNLSVLRQLVQQGVEQGQIYAVYAGHALRAAAHVAIGYASDTAINTTLGLAKQVQPEVAAFSERAPTFGEMGMAVIPLSEQAIRATIRKHLGITGTEDEMSQSFITSLMSSGSVVPPGEPGWDTTPNKWKFAGAMLGGLAADIGSSPWQLAAFAVSAKPLSGSQAVSAGLRALLDLREARPEFAAAIDATRAWLKPFIQQADLYALGREFGAPRAAAMLAGHLADAGIVEADVTKAVPWIIRTIQDTTCRRLRIGPWPIFPKIRLGYAAGEIADAPARAVKQATRWWDNALRTAEANLAEGEKLSLQTRAQEMVDRIPTVGAREAYIGAVAGNLTENRITEIAQGQLSELIRGRNSGAIGLLRKGYFGALENLRATGILPEAISMPTQDVFNRLAHDEAELPRQVEIIFGDLAKNDPASTARRLGIGDILALEEQNVRMPQVAEVANVPVGERLTFGNRLALRLRLEANGEYTGAAQLDSLMPDGVLNLEALPAKTGEEYVVARKLRSWADNLVQIDRKAGYPEGYLDAYEPLRLRGGGNVPGTGAVPGEAQSFTFHQKLSPFWLETLASQGAIEQGAIEKVIQDPLLLFKARGRATARGLAFKNLDDLTSTYGLRGIPQPIRDYMGWESVLRNPETPRFLGTGNLQAPAGLSEAVMPAGWNAYVKRVLTPYSNTRRLTQRLFGYTRVLQLARLTFPLANVFEQPASLTMADVPPLWKAQAWRDGIRALATTVDADLLYAAELGTPKSTLGAWRMAAEKWGLGRIAVSDAVDEGVYRGLASEIIARRIGEFGEGAGAGKALMQDVVAHLRSGTVFRSGPAGQLLGETKHWADNLFRNTFGLSVRTVGGAEDLTRGLGYAVNRFNGASHADALRNIFTTGFVNYMPGGKSPLEDAAGQLMYFSTYYLQRARQIPLAFAERPWLATLPIAAREAWIDSAFSPQDQWLIRHRPWPEQLALQMVPWPRDLAPLSWFKGSMTEQEWKNTVPFISLRWPFLEIWGDLTRYAAVKTSQGQYEIAPGTAVLKGLFPAFRALGYAKEGKWKEAFGSMVPVYRWADKLFSETWGEPDAERSKQLWTRYNVPQELRLPAMAQQLQRKEHLEALIPDVTGVLVNIDPKLTLYSQEPWRVKAGYQALQLQAGEQPFPYLPGDANQFNKEFPPTPGPDGKPLRVTRWDMSEMAAQGVNPEQIIEGRKAQVEQAQQAGIGLNDWAKANGVRNNNRGGKAYTPISQAALDELNKRRLAAGNGPDGKPLYPLLSLEEARQMEQVQLPGTIFGLRRLMTGQVDMESGMCSRTWQESEWQTSGQGNANEIARKLRRDSRYQDVTGSTPQPGDTMFTDRYGHDSKGNLVGHITYLNINPATGKLEMNGNFEGRMWQPIPTNADGTYDITSLFRRNPITALEAEAHDTLP